MEFLGWKTISQCLAFPPPRLHPQAATMPQTSLHLQECPRPLMRSRFPNAKTLFNRFQLSPKIPPQTSIWSRFFSDFNFFLSCAEIFFLYCSIQIHRFLPGFLPSFLPGFLPRFLPGFLPRFLSPILSNFLPRVLTTEGSAGLCQLFQIVCARRQPKCATHCSQPTPQLKVFFCNLSQLLGSCLQEEVEVWFFELAESPKYELSEGKLLSPIMRKPAKQLPARLQHQKSLQAKAAWASASEILACLRMISCCSMIDRGNQSSAI